MKNRSLLAFLVFATAVTLHAQNASSPTAGAAQGQNQTDTQNQTQFPSQTSSQAPEAENSAATTSSSATGAPVPLPLNLDAGSLEFSSEMEHSNYLHGGVNLGTSYDDNLLATPSQPVGGFSYTVMPNIGLDLSRPRARWEFNYAGGFLVNQRFSAYNQSSHSASVDMRFRLSPHVNFRVSDHYVLTSSFLDQLQSATPGPAAGVVQQPNLAVITPLARQNNNLGAAEITYQFSAGDMVGASGTYYTSRFGSTPAGSNALLDTTTEEADGFYSHRFTARNWSGIAYKFQRLSFNPSTEQIDTHSFLLFHTIYIQPRMQLAFFAGPEYSELNSQIISTSVTLPFVSVVAVPTSNQNWSVSGGSSFSWQGEHTSFRASGTRKVSDGGGLLTAVRLTTGSGALRRQLTRTATLELGAIYGDSQSLTPGISTFSEVKSATGSLVWEQRFGRNFTASLGYARDYQQENVATPPTLDVNHNRGWATLGYQFTRPLGR